MNPTKIVDNLIAIWLDLTIPGGGVGERSFWMSGWRMLQQTERRASKEMEIRNDLYRWDCENPQCHHELIVRYLCGALASLVCTCVYNELVDTFGRNNRSQRRGGTSYR